MQRRKGWLRAVREADSIARLAKPLLHLELTLARVAPTRPVPERPERAGLVSGPAFARLVLEGRIDSRWSAPPSHSALPPSASQAALRLTHTPQTQTPNPQT